MRKIITEIIIEKDDNGNIFFNDKLIPPPNFNDFSNKPDYCQSCPNHPSNGGSGICHCILGLPQVTC